MKDTEEYTELSIFLEIMEQFEEPKCESNHSSGGGGLYGNIGTECSIKVVGRKTVSHSRYTFNICASSLVYNTLIMNDPIARCKCGETCGDCWSIDLT